MPRRLSPEKQLELDSLFRVISTIADWADSMPDRPPNIRMADPMRQAYQKRNLAGLRMAYNDLVEMTNAATPAQRRTLDALLRERANTTLEALSAKKIRRIERIRTRGRLTSEEQYYMVREHVEFIFDDPSRTEEVHDLLDMLNAYEERFAERARTRGITPDNQG